MIFYCSNCWSEIDIDALICPNCKSDQSVLTNLSFKEKLLAAINHPEPSTPIRVAEICTRLKINEAIPVMINRLRYETDPFIIISFVKSIMLLDNTNKDKIRKILSEDSLILINKLPEYNNA